MRVRPFVLASLILLALPAIGQDDLAASVEKASDGSGDPQPDPAIVRQGPESLQQGRWSHQVPFEVPGGPNGLVPTVGLTANHHAKGIVGSGWDQVGGSAARIAQFS